MLVYLGDGSPIQCFMYTQSSLWSIFHLINDPNEAKSNLLVVLGISLGPCFSSNILQKRNRSSAPRDATVVPSGDRAVCVIISVCSFNETSSVIRGKVQRDKWFVPPPCEVTNSREFLDHKIDVTCEVVATDFSNSPLAMFQNLTVRS